MEGGELLGKPLDGFSVKRMYEVYKTNEDGRKTGSVGFFRDKDVAEGVKETLRDPSYHEVDEALVLTDGKVGFLIGEEVKLLSDEQGMLDIKRQALAKLSPAQARALGHEKPRE